MTNLSKNAVALLKALRSNSECDVIPSDDDVAWGEVYLDNAFHDVPEIAVSQRGGYLAALTTAGLYREVDGSTWGMVRQEDR